MSEVSIPPARATPASEMLWGFWYPGLRSRQISERKLNTAMLLGIPLVLGRDRQGRAYALRDNCPHRGMPLSFGRAQGGVLECCYHGWKFDVQTGQCRQIPSLVPGSKLNVERIFATSYPAQERDGYIWVFMPEPGAGNTPASEAPQLAVFSPRYRSTHLAAELPCGVDHGVIGLMDPAHGPFVHQAWWWRKRESIREKQKVFEPIANGFRMRAHEPSKNSAPYKLLRLYGNQVTTTIDFVLPNMRTEQLRCGDYWFSSLTTVTPITPERCRIDFVAAWNIFPWLPFAVPIFRLFARMFLRQDQGTMEKQAVGLKHNPALMLIDDADRPAKWYFQLKAAHLEARRTGQPFRHPISAPVTLRWRS